MYVITDDCNNCKFTDCVLVCPVDCFYELETQLVIHPDVCIGCHACVSECPVEAIFPEDEVPEKFHSAIEFNRKEALRLDEEGAESLIEMLDPLPTAEEKKKRLGF